MAFTTHVLATLQIWSLEWNFLAFQFRLWDAFSLLLNDLKVRLIARTGFSTSVFTEYVPELC